MHSNSTKNTEHLGELPGRRGYPFGGRASQVTSLPCEAQLDRELDQCLTPGFQAPDRAPFTSLTVLKRGHYWATLNADSVLNSGHSRTLSPSKGTKSVYRRCKCLYHNISNPVSNWSYGDSQGGGGSKYPVYPLDPIIKIRCSPGVFSLSAGRVTGQFRRFST